MKKKDKLTDKEIAQLAILLWSGNFNTQKSSGEEIRNKYPYLK